MDETDSEPVHLVRRGDRRAAAMRPTPTTSARKPWSRRWRRSATAATRRGSAAGCSRSCATAPGISRGHSPAGDLERLELRDRLPAAPAENEREGGRYSVVADTIRFHDDDGDDGRDDDGEVDVDDLAIATLAADGTLTGRLRDGRTTLVFRP